MRAKTFQFLRALPIALFHDMHQGNITLRAMGLVYTTLLSLVPLLALSFSMLKGFGVHNQMEPLLLKLLEPMGAKALELTQQILGFVDNMQVGVLGFAGLAILLYTVISLMGKVEEAFNFVWRVKRPRSFLAQFRDYLSVVLVGPLLLFSALGLWGAFSQWEIVHTVVTLKPLSLVLQTSPTVLIVLAFTLLYLFMPNTHVKPWAALGGATFAGVAWQIAGWLFASFVVSSGQQTAIYSIFASLFLFMLWLYVGWLIVLTGARLAYYFQYPDAVHLPQQPTETSMQTRELLTIAILREIGTRFLNKDTPATLDDLRQLIPVSRFLLENTLDELNIYGIISRDDDEPTHYLLRVSPDKLSVAEIRQRLWQGTPKQQQQATQIRQQAGISSEWLNTLVNTPDATMQQLIQAAPAETARDDQGIIR